MQNRGGGGNYSGYACKMCKMQLFCILWSYTCFLTSSSPNTLPLLMRKYIVKIIYFPSVRSHIFVLSWDKLKETNKETSLFGLTQRKLEWVVYNTELPKFVPLRKKTQIKLSNLESLIYHGGRRSLPERYFPRGVFSEDGG